MEGTRGGPLGQALCSSTLTLSRSQRTVCPWPLKISKDRDSTTSSDNLCHHLTAPGGKICHFYLSFHSTTFQNSHDMTSLGLKASAVAGLHGQQGLGARGEVF